jgi:predicted MFS family arabinose efflux permease
MSLSPALRAALSGLCALALAMGVGRFAYTPVLPLMQADLGLSIPVAGYIASANFAGYLAGALLAIWVASPLRRQAYVGAILTSVATTLLMTLLHQPLLIALVRLLSGIASAFVLVHGSAIVLDQLARERKSGLSSLLYAGVGTGIALSALLVAMMSHLETNSFAHWLVLGLACAALAPGALMLRDDLAPVSNPSAGNATTSAIPTQQDDVQEAETARALRWLVLAYGCLGFGYVITATFLVVMMRGNSGWQAYEMLVWLLVGLAAAPSNLLWMRIAARLGPWRTMTLAFVLEAIGVAAAVAGNSLSMILLGALLLGGTFMGITALGLTTARALSQQASGPVIARMTAAFGLGQIVGPAFGGWLAERSGGFGWPSAVAALALLAAGAIVWICGQRLGVRRQAPSA